jgi:hypothetical protein
VSWGIFAWRGKSAAPDLSTSIFAVRASKNILLSVRVRGFGVRVNVEAGASKWVPNANILAHFSAYSLQLLFASECAAEHCKPLKYSIRFIALSSGPSGSKVSTPLWSIVHHPSLSSIARYLFIILMFFRQFRS